ncbi:cyclic nucleotide-binding/CBS domain-containing protein [Tessaracoccus lubricantis]|uniref:Cyclic nucleotide-binding/CBS domain-containing protein n=1 Tax=Tessaracoccus lubricantis TaxID=545543 RepID=A0ABP9FKV5_9ACTN
MSELAETTQFLAAREPWSLLAPVQIESFARRAVGQYVRRGEVVLAAGQAPLAMFVVRSGAIEIVDADGVLIDHDEQGDCFGQSSILEERPSRFTFTAIEDSLLWSFAPEVVRELVAFPEVRRFFTEARLGDVVRHAPGGGPVLQVPVREMITRSPVTIDVGHTVRRAAQAMAEHRISAIIVTRGDGDLAGILTDRDLRRVVAEAIDPDTALSSVMSEQPFTIDAEALALDVLLSLVQHKIHHLPVLEDGRVVGMVTSGDLMRLERSSPLYMVGDLARQDDVPGLVKVMGRVPALVGRLLRQDATAEDITRIISRTTEALCQRVAEMAEAELGAPPVPYAWVALGSLARQEQALGSDQDHAFILSDEARPEHDHYFAALAEYVTAALVACGFPRCRGEAMATDPRWRVPLRQWQRTFSGWLAAPTSEAVLNSSIFFDMRPVHGDQTLYTSLQQHVLRAAPGSTRFLGHLAKHANDAEVPVGFLRGFVVEKRGEHRDRLDIKLGGINPIVDVARIYALRWALPQVSTRARLAAAAEHGAEVDNLLDAHEFLGYTRLQHQGRLVAAGREPDNHIDPAALSDFERRSLRDAFVIVGKAQTALTVAFQTQYIS